uniref:Uncharacterized protein n=1 Tax=Parascaris equorum TaxID=6256 RepID=A0A914SEB9_PAREQ
MYAQVGRIGPQISASLDEYAHMLALFIAPVAVREVSLHFDFVYAFAIYPLPECGANDSAFFCSLRYFRNVLIEALRLAFPRPNPCAVQRVKL